MYSTFHLAKKYLHYYFTALNGKGHGIHSPFIFDFVLHVLNNQKNYQPNNNIEQVRQHLIRSKDVITVTDLGAGSRVVKSSEKKVSRIARNAVKPPKYSKLLYRLVKHYQPKTIIELGTSLGISTAYLASANPSATLVTIEGSDAIASIAQNNFSKLQLTNVISVVGNFDDVLPKALENYNQADLAYIDGNHRYAPTINYFNQILQKIDRNSILIFDDIHWSKEMEQAWNEIKNHPSVKYTVDIFFLGFVFFKKDFLEKQHFVIRF
ncbi:MAG TPA: class I SAM-dependent methyltransferase [Flavisolibacter sp.]|nr:class I SAM-dependent methyltransferase [Flavisolibacter sp.]